MSKYAEATVEGFDAYHAARGRERPGTVDDAELEAKLLVASEWIDDKYGSIFLGWKRDGFLQEREWPRTNAVVNTSIPPYIIPDDTVPVRVINAVYEAAWFEMLASGSLTKNYTPNKYDRVSVDGAVSVDFATVMSAADIQTSYPTIDALLSPLFDLNVTGFSSYSGSAARV